MIVRNPHRRLPKRSWVVVVTNQVPLVPPPGAEVQFFPPVLKSPRDIAVLDLIASRRAGADYVIGAARGANCLRLRCGRRCSGSGGGQKENKWLHVLCVGQSGT